MKRVYKGGAMPLQNITSRRWRLASQERRLTTNVDSVAGKGAAMLCPGAGRGKRAVACCAGMHVGAKAKHAGMQVQELRKRVPVEGHVTLQRRCCAAAVA